MTRWIVMSMLLALAVGGASAAIDATGTVAKAPAASAQLHKVDVNTAGAAELESLPGIGPAIAQRIIEHRRDKGRFEKVEDLLAVKGIGPKLLSRLRDRIVIGPAETARR
jgi:competence protein ComEA